MFVNVYDNEVDQALKALKKKMQRNGITQDMKKKRHYEKPSEKKKRKHEEALRKMLKRRRRDQLAN